MNAVTQHDPARVANRMMALAETSAHTPMGKVLRKFWHPIELSSAIAPGTSKEVRLLGEDLALYRGESGTPHLMVNRCAHRLTKLHTGWIEGESLRCMYHGWKYDASGQCVERPAERPGSETGIRVTTYAVHEYAGLIFAYLGEGEPPVFDLPRKPVFERKDVMLFQRHEVWPCNWLQHAENSLDALHVSFAHQTGIVGVFGEAVSTTVPELRYEETLAGVRQTAIRAEGETSHVRISEWTFPYANHVALPPITEGAPWMEVSNFMVPIDDTYTKRVTLIAVESTTAAADADMRSYFDGCQNYNAADHHDDLYAGKYPDDPLICLTSAQDYVTLVGQGVIADRANERLASSDRGIAMLRRILWREMEAINTGQPTKAWRRNEDTPILSRSVETASLTRA